MDAKLIYSYLLSLAACLAVSCTTDTSGGKVNRGAELSFEAPELTRASVTTSLDKFAVYGDMQFKDNIQVLFNKTEVVRDPDNDKWSYAGTQYWFPRHVHSFVAITPVSAFGPDNEPLYSESEHKLSFTYTLPDNFKSAHDLMAATHRREMPKDDPSYSAAPVRFNFFHIMSRVNFQVKNDGAADTVRVTKIVLEGVDKRGTFTIAPASLSEGGEQTDDYDSSWSDISNKGSVTANISVDIFEDGSQPLFPDDNALFVIPQPDNKDIIMSITYTRYDANDEPEELTLTAETPIGGWEYGKVYTYSFDISEITKEIYLTVSVKRWQTPKATEIKVPEY